MATTKKYHTYGKNQRQYDDTPIRKRIKKLEDKLFQLYRKETRLSGEGRIQTKTATLHGKRVKFKCVCWTDEYEHNGETDTFHITRTNCYSYTQAVFEDLIDYYCENLPQENWEILAEGDESDARYVAECYEDSVKDSDSVTGNETGSYFCNTWKAMEALYGNDETLQEALDALDMKITNEDGTVSPERNDCIIRFFIAGQQNAAAVRRLQLALQAKLKRHKIEGINE